MAGVSPGAKFGRLERKASTTRSAISGGRVRGRRGRVSDAGARDFGTAPARGRGGRGRILRSRASGRERIACAGRDAGVARRSKHIRYYKRLLSEETSRGEMGEGCAGDALRDDVDEIHLGGCERRAVRSACARGARGARGALTWSPSRQKCFSAQSTMYSLGGVPSTGMSTWRRGTGGGSSRASASEAMGICDDGGGRGEPRAERVVVVSEGTRAASGPGGARTDHDRHGDLGRFVRDARAHPLGLLRGLLRLRHSRGRRGGKAARRTRRARV